MKLDVNDDLLKRTGMIMGNLGCITTASKDHYEKIYKDIFTAKMEDLLEGKVELFSEKDSFAPIETINDSAPVSVASEAFGLKGPCYSIDAACASSIYVLKLASYFLLSGKVDMMIAGGVSEVEKFGASSLFSILDVLPPNCDSKPFDKDTKGLTLATGGGAFALKRYEDAVRDGDEIHAVIEGIGLSNDGGGKYILAPAVSGQVASYEKAYEGLSKDVDYIECHATGTSVGDIIELDSIAKFFKENKVKPLIGAVKPNMGHILTASGMSAMIKVIMAMKNNTIPATIGVENPTKSTDGSYDKEQMVLENTVWPKNSREKRAGISAFGFGGSNAHVVLSEHSDEYFNEYSESKKLEDSTPSSIVGMGINVGGVRSIRDYADLIFKGKNKVTDLPENRWMNLDKNKRLMQRYGISEEDTQGMYISDLDVDFLKFGVSPNSSTRPIFKEFVLLDAADQAILDAGLRKGVDKKVAVIVELEAEGATHRSQFQPYAVKHVQDELTSKGIKLSEEDSKKLRVMFRDSIVFDPDQENALGGLSCLLPNRISSVWGFEGPSIKLSSQENSAAVALELAQFLLSTREVDSVVVGSVDFGGTFENILTRSLYAESLGLDTYRTTGEGAAVIVLKEKEDIKSGDAYAEIKASISRNIDTDNSVSDIKSINSELLKSAKVDESKVSHIEMASGIDSESLELPVVRSIYSDKVSYSSAETNLAYTNNMSFLTSVIKAAIELNTNFKADESNGLFKQLDASEFSHVLISNLAKNSSYGLSILSKSDSKKFDFISAKEKIFIFAAKDKKSLIGKIESVKEKAAKNFSLYYLAQESYKDYLSQSNPEELLFATIIASTKADLNAEVNSVLEAINGGVSVATKAFSSYQPNRREPLIALDLGQNNELVSSSLANFRFLFSDAVNGEKMSIEDVAQFLFKNFNLQFTKNLLEADYVIDFSKPLVKQLLEVISISISFARPLNLSRFFRWEVDKKSTREMIRNVVSEQEILRSYYNKENHSSLYKNIIGDETSKKEEHKLDKPSKEVITPKMPSAKVVDSSKPEQVMVEADMSDKSDAGSVNKLIELENLNAVQKVILNFKIAITSCYLVNSTACLLI